MTRRLSLGVLALVLATPASSGELAAAGTASESHTEVERSELTESERVHAQSWGLTHSEWHRYRQLMQGVRGAVSDPRISPIEVLGIHARSDSERRRYAEQWSRLMHEDAERVLAFQHAYDEANSRLYPDERLIATGQLPLRSSVAAELQPGDHILLFAGRECPRCNEMLESLLVKVQSLRNLTLDVYLVDSGRDDTAVREWARERLIPPHLVTEHRVTLNHNGGLLKRLAAARDHTPTLPWVLVRRGEQLLSVDSGHPR